MRSGVVGLGFVSVVEVGEVVRERLGERLSRSRSSRLSRGLETAGC
jgi:hypothetical protein